MTTTFRDDPEGKKETLYRLILSAPADKAPAIFAALASIAEHPPAGHAGKNSK